MVTVPLPHLAGLAAAVRVDLDDRVPTMGIFASGRLVANPAFTARLSGDDLVFVLAHELLHLALRTHDRARGSGRLEFNYAHDYIINDMLRHALGVTTIPAGGLDMPGAREKSAEEIVLEMRRTSNVASSRTQVWEGMVTTLEQVLGAARQAPPEAWATYSTRGASASCSRTIARTRPSAPVRSGISPPGAWRSPRPWPRCAAAAPRRALRSRRSGRCAGSTARPGSSRSKIWLEGVAPGERTFTRASRRGSDRSDVVMPGRKRYSWMLNVVLDTSASMSDEIPFALGAIADFCDVTGVDEIRLVQCDTVVTSDEVLSPSELADYQVSGYGGSDLTPALLALAEDPRVTAAVVITDGDIGYPSESVPYAVLWALPHSTASFQPLYGRVITMHRENAL